MLRLFGALLLVAPTTVASITNTLAKNESKWPIDPNFSVPNTTAWLIKPTKAQVNLLASSIDWRAKGAVTPVKSQCGGTCWSFSATGNMEGAWAAAGRGLISLSEQYLQDCNRPGSGPYGIPIITDSTMGGAASENQYPTYDGTDPGCGHTACKPIQDFPVHVISVQCLPNGGAEEDILNLLQNGPVGTSIASNGIGGYSGGIIGRDQGGDCGASTINHAVLIVGFDTDTDGTPYWIMKNSWGTGFGEGGFWRMKYGVNCMRLADGGPCQAQV